MKCLYINLDSAPERRQAIEASFRRHAKPGFQLERLPAITAQAADREGVAGKAPAAARAAFLSHRRAILAQRPDDEPTMILEDDVAFGPTFFQAIGPLVHPSNFSLDLLFTDICVPSAAMMTELARARPLLTEGRRISVLELKKARFAGSTAYVVNPKALQKLQALLQVPRIDKPYDIFLRDLILSGVLKAGVTFPFLTSLSQHSDTSAIQPGDTLSADLIWNTFRKLMWADRDLDECEPLLKSVRDNCCDAESLRLAPILCALASRRFRPK